MIERQLINIEVRIISIEKFCGRLGVGGLPIAWRLIRSLSLAEMLSSVLLKMGKLISELSVEKPSEGISHVVT